MRLFYLLKKELIEIFRQREMLVILFIAPILQTVILGFAVTTDVTNIPISVVNLSDKPVTGELILRLDASPLFRINTITSRPLDEIEVFRRGTVKAIVLFRDPAGGGQPFPEVQIQMDGVESNTSLIAAGYVNGIIRSTLLEEMQKIGRGLPLDSSTTIRFNPSLRSINYMGPGIVALLLTITSIFLTSIGLVREKEQQTMDTLRVSPLTALEIFAGKAFPLALLGLIEMGLGIGVVILIFGIPLRGSIFSLLLAAFVFLLAALSYGLLISTLSSSQQQAMFYGWFSMVTFLLLSGLFTPVDNIPRGLRWLADINPLRYLIQMIRKIFLKGSGPAEFQGELLSLSLIACVVIVLSLLNYRRFVSR
jgi:ABC-2 type transport system permease protein